ncbi:uncharacterized protein LOC131666734 [Phymastichus coffea]|uniref:uncharacterized protein LOC131666734 n=1 Tax=Phymastichus coffea TaxID=108790 RepID=UPI00273C07D7|nr:uncharacterized protein LOC131666734 [Phymastichus coffea]
MHDERFIVKYVTANNCFAYLPEHWLRKLSSKAKALRVQHNDVNYYLSWYARPSPDNSRLCLSATFARTLNIKEGDEVFVSCAEEPPSLTSLAVAPKSSHDQEILDLQSDVVQANLLNQITIVARGQTIVAWISKFLSVTLIVTSLNPEFKYGRLEENTEIHVGDAAVAKPAPLQSSSNEADKDSADSILGDLPSTPAVKCTYRLHPLPTGSTQQAPFKIYVHRSQLPAACTENGMKFAWLRKVKQDRESVKSGALFIKKIEGPTDFMVEIATMEDSDDYFVQSNKAHFAIFAKHPCIYITESLQATLRMKIGAKVVLTFVNDLNDNNATCTTLDIFPSETPVSEEMLRSYVSHNSSMKKLLINSYSKIAFEDGNYCFIKMSPENCKFAFFDEESLGSVEIKVNDMPAIEDLRMTEDESDDIEMRISRESTSVLQQLITECMNVLTLSLGLYNIKKFDYERENILISGATGSGKTTVCKLLRKTLSEPPFFVNTRYINCRSLKGKKVELVQKFLAVEISQVVYYQPSIIFFDDIESITTAPVSTDENTPDSMNAARVTDAIFSAINKCQSTNSISVVATCTDITKVGRKLKEARGVHFFRTMLTIPNLEKEDRIKILRSSLQDKLYLAKEIDWDYYGNKTEDWVVQDLVVLADKAAFTTWKRHVKEKIEGSLRLCDADLSESLSRYLPLSLHGVSLYKGVGHSWSDVGGLAKVKDSLIEILHWPLKYPEIFKKAPIKLQSGILLYGMPGTGKTMLAGAIAKECGLNLISIKGPELLSKYIGASEEAVRNVFEKAKRAKPCVLFFDEFDSLAPRRGHDSTGVTDRVVNQLLTHLDGIEGREGVAVVAASSRPDLLDPALLRPGRLDRSLLCPLPNESDRKEILEAVCRMHGIDMQNLDLTAIAKMTDGFTGADLNAVVIQARLNVIEGAIDASGTDYLKNHDPKDVKQDHLLDSLKSTKPSLLASEKAKYTRIYAKFAKSDSCPIEDMKHQKATLA